MQLPARDERAEAAALNAPDPGTIPGGVGLAIYAANEPRWRCTPAALPAGALQRLLPELTQGVWPLRRLLDMPPDMPQTLGGRASAGLGAEAARGPAVGQKLAWQAAAGCKSGRRMRAGLASQKEAAQSAPRPRVEAAKGGRSRARGPCLALKPPAASSPPPASKVEKLAAILSPKRTRL